ncbi:hypothetical protein Syun_005021 [Stephania yunnanensis]|uniref:Uncharacterized protein n=1 Tax=Stephania yunnanensis TaxID=152371 RepID=A0AAP0L7I7_9MAGN
MPCYELFQAYRTFDISCDGSLGIEFDSTNSKQGTKTANKATNKDMKRLWKSKEAKEEKGEMYGGGVGGMVEDRLVGA